MSQLFASGGQSIGASASVLPVNIQGWFPLRFAVQGTPKSLLQHHSSKESILWCSVLFMVQLSHLYMTTGKPCEVKWSEVPRLCTTLCDPMDCGLPESSVNGILQARILEWVAIFFSRGFSWSRDRTWVSGIVGRRFTVWAPREAYMELCWQGDVSAPYLSISISHNNFKVYNTVMVTIVTMLSIHGIPRIYSFHNWKFVSLDLYLHNSPLTPATSNHHSTLFLWVWLFYISSISDTVQYVSIPGWLFFFYLVLKFHLYYLSQMAWFPSFLWLDNIPL